MIVAAAIKYSYNGFDYIMSAPPPARHHTLLHARPGELDGIPTEQGFMTDYGAFVDRETAKMIAIVNRQVFIEHTSFDFNEPRLFSEDLW